MVMPLSYIRRAKRSPVSPFIISSGIGYLSSILSYTFESISKISVYSGNTAARSDAMMFKIIVAFLLSCPRSLVRPDSGGLPPHSVSF
jgi:hypothetical protein